jgi:poly(3-hydroxybutyrate) depolymerase
MAINRPTTSSLIAVIAAGLAVSPGVLAQQSAPAAGAPPAAPADPWAAGVDPRVEQRTYLFTETNEQLPYALFVSSKVSRRRAAPVIVALHGLSGTQNTMVGTRLNTIELAEQGGYIFVSPMGYNCGGWYGIPPRAPNPAATTGQPPAANGANPANGPGRGVGRGGRGGPMQCAGGGTAVTDAARVRELSEKDVMTVLEMVREEFNVDENRIYLMGHSMGGSGTLYLGGKYPELWAAIAADAPPGPGSAEALATSQMPVLVVQGDKDTAVPVANTRAYIARLSELNAAYRYIEIGGLDHNIAGIADIYEFFAEHVKSAP